MSSPGLTRRELITGTGAVLAGGVFAASQSGREGPLAAAPDAGTTVLLTGRSGRLPRDLLQRFPGSPARVIQLEADPVRQWRGSEAALLAARDTRLFGVSTWPQFLIVRGLVEESGRRVRFQQLEPDNSSMIWIMA